MCVGICDPDANLSTMLDVGLAIEQETDDLSPSLEAREGESCVSVGLDLGVDV